MLRWRPALLAVVPGFVLSGTWLRLEHPQRDGGRALLLIAAAVLPALAPRLWQRLVLLALAALAAIDLAVRVPVPRSWLPRKVSTPPSGWTFRLHVEA